MNRLKFISATLFILLSGYTYIISVSNPLNGSTKGSCTTTQYNSFTTWDSGCFYSAVFEKSPSKTQLTYEHKKLNTFHRKGGVAQHVTWYRSIFYRRFKNHFNIDDDSLEQMHKDFTAVNPTRLASQISYIDFLFVNSEEKRAQNYIDYYCQHYVPANIAQYVYETLSAKFNEPSLTLSFETCTNKYSKSS